MARCCTLFNLRHSARISHAPWTNGLIEVQNKNLGTHVRMYPHDTPENSSIQVHFSVYAHDA